MIIGFVLDVSNVLIRTLLCDMPHRFRLGNCLEIDSPFCGSSNPYPIDLDSFLADASGYHSLVFLTKT